MCKERGGGATANTTLASGMTRRTHVSSVIRNESASRGASCPCPCCDAAAGASRGSGASVAVSEKSTVSARLPGREKRMKTRPSVQDSKRSDTRICAEGD